MDPTENEMDEDEQEPDGLIVDRRAGGAAGYTTVDDGTLSRRRQPAILVLSTKNCLRFCAVIASFLALTVATLVALRQPNVHLFTSETAGSSLNRYGISWLQLPHDDQALTRITFGSCSNQNMPQPYFDTIAAESPDLLIFMGDNIYGDCYEDHCQNLEAAYKKWAAHASFRGATQLIPIIATLDDHDCEYVHSILCIRMVPTFYGPGFHHLISMHIFSYFQTAKVMHTVTTPTRNWRSKCFLTFSASMMNGLSEKGFTKITCLGPLENEFRFCC
jgi:hypothetical protein